MILSEELPESIKAWLLKGKGLESFGNNGKPDLIDFPSFTEDDVIGRVDAVGICFSDVKLIRSGNEHPRIMGRNLKENPVIPGHEVALTIIGVGDNRKGKVELGGRYIVQADVFYRGKSIAYGYVLPGGYSEYTVIGREILDGDEGSYLIPVKRETGFSEAALVEPWACVVASYQIKQRVRPLEGGNMLFYGMNDKQIKLNLSGLEKDRPDRVYTLGLDNDNAKVVRDFCNINKVEHEEIASFDLMERKSLSFDDVAIIGVPDEREMKIITRLTSNGGVISIHDTNDNFSKRISEKLSDDNILVDVGSIHYRQIRITGSDNGGITESYRINTRNHLKKGGRAWFVGGAGPMGQMHIIKAVMDPDGPSEILITDLSDARIDSVMDRINHLAKKREIIVETINPGILSNEEFEDILGRKYTEGFDDVVVLVPVAGVIEQASRFLAKDGMINVFAGVKIGTYVSLKAELILRRHVNILGSSGSPLSAMKKTLELVEKGMLSTNMSLAAVCDMDSVSDGVKAVMEARYNGKIVVFPKASGMGVVSVEELGRILPDVGELLIEDKYWTNKAESVFLKSKYFKAEKI